MGEQESIKVHDNDPRRRREIRPDLRMFINSYLMLINDTSLINPRTVWSLEDLRNSYRAADQFSTFVEREEASRQYERAEELIESAIYYFGGNEPQISNKFGGPERFRIAKKDVRTALDNAPFSPRGDHDREMARFVLEVMALPYVALMSNFDPRNTDHINNLGNHLTSMLVLSNRHQLASLSRPGEILQRFVEQRPPRSVLAA